jgi:predicted O-methyltransferase YrrM
MIDWCGLHRNYLNAGEMEVIADLVAEVEAKTMLEIGCRDGRTARVLLQNVPTLERYIGVDIPKTSIPTLPHQRSEQVSIPGYYAKGDPRFELILRERGSLDLSPDELPDCDAVFIDGDHSEGAVLCDSHLAATIVRPGGVIIWHDAFNGAVEVKRVLDRLHMQGWGIENVPDTWIAYCTGSDRWDRGSRR